MNPNADFGKPDTTKRQQRQRNRDNFTNSIYQKLCEKRQADFGNLARRKNDFAKRNRLDQSKPKLTETQAKNLEANFSDSIK
jgi:hypothetical protein